MRNGWLLSLLVLAQLWLVTATAAPEVAITIDDPETFETPPLSGIERNRRILAALEAEGLKAALFVCGMRIDSAAGADLLKSWSDAGHWLANHTYSHRYFHSASLTADAFVADAFRVDPLLTPYAGFRKLFRFPMLKEGDTREKRDRMRAELRARGYKHGYVTIDASDWYIDGRLRARLAANPNADTSGYRDYYLKHIWERANYYDGLAKRVFGREIKHTLLLHHNHLNALYLKDVLAMFKARGWKLISPEAAYSDPVFSLEPNILPAGEGIVWAAAKENGNFASELRYPAEDSVYESAEMDRLGL